MTLPTIDTHEFTRRGDAAEGVEPIAALDRLASMLVDADGRLSWRLSGRSELGPDGSRTPYLRLDASATVRMRCVRCLEPVEVGLDAVRDYRLVATEAQAEREDADEDALDLLVSSRRFDLAALVEDEAIMALPAAPRHADCSAPAAAPRAGRGPGRRSGPPGPAGGGDGSTDTGRSGGAGGAGPHPDDEAERPSPFAALAALRSALAPDPVASDPVAPDPGADGPRHAPGAAPVDGATPSGEGPSGSPGPLPERRPRRPR